MSGTNAYVREIRARIDQYFKIVLRTCKETIPKLVGQFLVRASQEKLTAELQSRINDNEKILDALGEPKSVTDKRKMLQSISTSMREAMKLLQRDPDITAAATFDDGELAEELRKDAMDRKNQAVN